MATAKKKSKKKKSKAVKPKKARTTSKKSSPSKKATKKKATKKKAIKKKATKKKATKKKATKKKATKSKATKGNATKGNATKGNATKKKAVKPVVKAKKPISSKATKVGKVSRIKGIDWNNFLTPLDNRVVVEVEGPSEVTAGGIIIPFSVTEGPKRGRVLNVGEGHRDKKGRVRPMDVKKGDKILFGDYVGADFNVDGVDLLILREDEILGVLDK